MFLFFYQPVFHVLRRALALEVELHVVQGIAYLLEWGIGVEVGIVLRQDDADVAQAQPSPCCLILRTAEGFANHLHQVVQLLEGLVLLYQRLYLRFVQPIAFTFIKEVERLGIELSMVDGVFEIDVSCHTHTYETARSSG